MSIRKTAAYLHLRNSLAAGVVRGVYSRFYTGKARLKYRRILDSGRMNKWPIAQIFPTMACNLSCAMCHQKEYRSLVNNDMSFDELIKCADNIAASGIKKVWLIGGEIFMRKDIFAFLAYLEKRKFDVEVATNGMLLDANKINSLVSCGNIKKIEFSLDGLKNTHDKIRGVSGAFDKVVNSIKLTAAKKKFTVVVTFVLQEDNLADVRPVIQLCRSLGADVFNITMKMDYSREDISESARILGIPQEKISVARQISAHNKITCGQLQELLLLVREEGRGRMRIVLYPEIAKKAPKEFLEGNIRHAGLKLFCNSLDLAVVDHNGDVLPCSFIKKSFGNVLKSPLKDILSCADFNNMRKHLLRGNLLPVCKYCCALSYIR